MQVDTKGLLSVQEKLGKTGLIFMIFLINMTAPMSTDMYLSAFPSMLEEFHTQSSMLNFTLVGFFLSFAIGMLLIGPISDKMGRKPILLGGVIFYGFFSFMCSQTHTIEQLIAFRMLQALGAGGMVSVSTAIVKDAFSDNIRPKIIALLQMLGAFAPTVAPIIGAQIVQHYSWRMTFDVLALISLLTLTFVCLLTETLPEHKRLKSNIFRSIWSIKDVIRIPSFMTFLFALAGPMIIYMSFLASSSYIYIQWFGLQETQFSIFFAVNSMILLIGPNVYLWARTRMSAHQIITMGFGLILLSAVLILSFGKLSPYSFLICFAPITFASGFLRSFSTNTLLAQENMNAGAAASVINFSNTAMGSLGMLLGGFNWGHVVNGIAYIAIIAMTFSILLWSLFNIKKMKLKGV